MGCLVLEDRLSLQHTARTSPTKLVLRKLPAKHDMPLASSLVHLAIAYLSGVLQLLKYPFLLNMVEQSISPQNNDGAAASGEYPALKPRGWIYH